jgi:hypothetical protein
MRTTLAALGVKLQYSTPLSPWENGRIERFFGSLKQALATALVPTMSAHSQLAWFRNYYNHVRPHQHLGYRTPKEAWTGIERQCGDTLADLWEGQKRCCPRMGLLRARQNALDSAKLRSACGDKPEKLVWKW